MRNSGGTVDHMSQPVGAGAIEATTSALVVEVVA